MPKQLIVLASRAARCGRRCIFARDAHTVGAHVFGHCLGPRRVELRHANHTRLALLRGWQLHSVGESTVGVVSFKLRFALSRGSDDGLRRHYHTSLFSNLAVLIALVAIIVRRIRFTCTVCSRIRHTH